jgi:hypothetical protein
MKKSCFVFVAFMLLASSLFAQRSDPPTIERIGTRTAESSPYPVLYYKVAPEDIPNGRHSIDFPSVSASDAIEFAMYHLIVYLSYYAPSDAGSNFQMHRFQDEFPNTGKFNLSFVTSNNSGIVSQIFIAVTQSKTGTFGLNIQYVFVPKEYQNN